MFFDELRHVVYNTGNRNEGLATLGLGDEIIPVHNRQLTQRNTPVKLGPLLINLLLKLLYTSLFDFVGSEFLEIGRQTDLLPCPD